MQAPSSIDQKNSKALPCIQALELLQEISKWGNTTTIIQHGGSVFEFKGSFPRGEMGEGFYNLRGEAGFEGHINFSKIHSIQLQSRKHRGRESHAFVFIDSQGEVIFKTFLGRDAEGNLIPHQLEKFYAMQTSSTH